MVGERDRRAMQATALALAEQLDHRLRAIQGMANQLDPLTEPSNLDRILDEYAFLQSDFDAGLAVFIASGELLSTTGTAEFWQALVPEIERQITQLQQAPEPQAVLSPVIFPNQQIVLLTLVYRPDSGLAAVGAFFPTDLIRQTVAGTAGEHPETNLFVIDQVGQVLYQSGQALDLGTLPTHPGVAEALSGQSGNTYLDREQEHVVAYSYVPVCGWALVMEEPWESVSTPILRLTEYAPLVLLPVLGLSLLVVWFGTRRIVQPLLLLQERAARLGWGDYAAIEQPVGGISEIRRLQDELAHLARKLHAAQQGLRDYIGAMTAGQEDERRRLARELHDDTLQSLIALNQRAQLLSMRLEQATGGCEIPAGTREDTAALQSLAEGTIANLRRVTRALRPIYLEDLGLATALEMLAQEMSRDGLIVQYETSGRLPRLEPQVELALYRMVQEALSNVARHSGAARAWLSVRPNEVNARISVRDDGQGFEVPESPAAFAPSGHFGLLGLHERAEMVGANF